MDRIKNYDHMVSSAPAIGLYTLILIKIHVLIGINIKSQVSITGPLGLWY